jgi:hypothetical protein
VGLVSSEGYTAPSEVTEASLVAVTPIQVEGFWSVVPRYTGSHALLPEPVVDAVAGGSGSLLGSEVGSGLGSGLGLGQWQGALPVEVAHALSLLNQGDVLAIVSAVFTSIYLIRLSHHSSRSDNPLALSYSMSQTGTSKDCFLGLCMRL